ncbi:PDZ domain-containing protein [Aciduricibacillus chroicocephali]|uniref:PDZ domain-containing protein n=1 Tax=Aciduricibacillus chroicocephali TaxID=3054939 RepID=A0ABY9KT77_9BACI|nr:PDZ domain-containing protein [Bacillaceae bacterium 44XB]
MVESWLLELVKGIGRVFLNPMLYLAVFIMFFASLQRIRRERLDFGIMVKPLLAETKGVWSLTLLAGLIISIIMLGAGFVFSYETILVVNLAVVLLGITIRFSLLSAGYTIVLAALALYILPYWFGTAGFLNESLPHGVNYSGLAILAGLLIIGEALMLKRTKSNESFPSLELGKRGRWIGGHQLKKMGIVPFFVLIPLGAIEHSSTFWPAVTIGGNTYGLMLIPFVIGFSYRVHGDLPVTERARLAKQLLTVGFTVVIVACISIYDVRIAPLAFILAFLGKEWIHFQQRRREQGSNPIFHERKDGLMALDVLPNSPASRGGIQVGERVAKVNGTKISNVADLEEALLTSGSFCKLEVIGHDGEKRFEQTALYDTDHRHLGLVLVGEPYDQKYASRRMSEFQQG